ncbi:LOW QUALITY PROTEIN: 4-hydroxybutyrate coenzyme A transferase [Drosophila sulfurigaster albostrigata]|uniref:LOW QUALITY PROTEIN: 4-hydroxybutyrate coenzyme A transferase n=1 Tax=Drosophila sulfurigaster albostrigata TaxID=89887 RepID=UPI002D21D57B|nr:LOW QUALITY PROTEIN: 4-hydroxybutyrate coenzyme A transferase [Drosophila sulfurigaster albostrigata]
MSKQLARRVGQVNKFLTAASANAAATHNNYYTYVQELSHPIDREPPIVSAEEAVSCIKSGDTVFAQGAAGTPNVLLNAMTQHGKCNKLEKITVCHMHTEGPAEYCKPEYKDIFRSNSFFMGGNVRKAVAEGRGDNVPIFLHEIPQLFYKKIVKPDVTFIHVSPPDRHGFCSLGTSVDCVRAGLLNSKKIVAQINPNMPRTFGDSIIHKSHFDFAVEVNDKLPQHGTGEISPVEQKIGKLIAENLVKDGATLQMGIGSIPDAVLAALHNHKDLGIHSEMFANGVVDLVKKGCVTNSKKKMHRGRIVGSFLIGDQALYDFVNDNPFIEMLVIDYVNNTSIVKQQPRMTAINSCIEVDLTGQVCSDSIGTRFYSGFGGQVDFIRGAAEGLDGLGVPIIAMPSTTNKGESKIVPVLKPGAGVVTSRAHVHYVVTEHGIASLFGKNVRQRMYELIQIADPKHREALEKAACERLGVMPSPN